MNVQKRVLVLAFSLLFFWQGLREGVGSIYPEVELLDHMIILCWIFWETIILFFIVAASLYIPTSHAQEFQFPCQHLLFFCPHPHLFWIVSIFMGMNVALFLKKFFYLLFLAMLCLPCCPGFSLVMAIGGQLFSSCCGWGLLFIAVCGLLIAVAFLNEEHGF